MSLFRNARESVGHIEEECLDIYQLLADFFESQRNYICVLLADKPVESRDIVPLSEEVNINACVDCMYGEVCEAKNKLMDMLDLEDD